MARYLLIHFLVLVSLVSKAQTKDETQDWITDKINSYHLDNIYHDYYIYWESNSFILVTPISNVKLYEKIPLKEIKYVFVNSYHHEDREGYKLTLKGIADVGCVETGKYIDGRFVKSLTGNKVWIIELFFNKTFGENDLPNRMQKAFFHLIKIAGGEAKGESF